MAIIYWWLIPLWVTIIVTTTILYFKYEQKKTAKGYGIPIAHSVRITQLSSYRKLIKRHQLLAIICIFAAGFIAIIAIVLSTRPVAQSLVSPEQKNRDIMLCLDVSSSMFPTDEQVLATFTNLVDGFGGQRIGLTTFNSAPVTVFPLTDDYQLIKSYLSKGQKGFDALVKKGTLFTNLTSSEYAGLSFMIDGTTANSNAGSSLTGDGLAGCIGRMGNNEQHRSQSIVFATDNEASGNEIVTTMQAATYAKSKNIRVYAIDPGPSSDGGYTNTTAHTELQQAAIATGGKYYLSKNVQVQEIINGISQQEAVLYTAPPELVQTDIPSPFIILIVVVLFGLFVLLWRLGL